MTHSELKEAAYALRCAGYSIGQVAVQLGVGTNRVPTLAKDYMKKNGLPHWDEVRALNDSGDAPAQTQPKQQSQPKPQAVSGRDADILRLAELRTVLETADSSDPVISALIADIARVSSGIVRKSR